MKAIQSKSMSEQVFEQIQNNIYEKVWKPGKKIPSEAVIVKETGASRVAVREAIKRLAGMGLLTVRQGDGTYVNEITSTQLIQRLAPVFVLQDADYRQLQEYRLVTEPQAAALAAQKAEPEDIAFLGEVVEKQKRHRLEEDVYIRMDYAFHTGIAQCTRNTILISIYEAVSEINHYAIRQAIDRLGNYETIHHERILEAIRQRRPEEAERCMREHILSNLQEF